MVEMTHSWLLRARRLLQPSCVGMQDRPSGGSASQDFLGSRWSSERLLVLASFIAKL